MLIVLLSAELVQNLSDVLGHNISLSVCFGGNDEILFTFQEFFDVDEPDVILDHRYLLLEATLFCLVLNFRKCFTHNSDEHVHKDNTINERSEKEHYPQKVSVTVFSILEWSVIEFTQTNQICTYESIKVCNSSIALNIWLKSLSIIGNIQIENIVEISESKEDDENHKHEVLCVMKGLRNKLDIVSSVGKHPHPVKHLDPHEEASKGCGCSDYLLIDGPFVFDQTCDDYSNESSIED
jgi:hypothetical protein